MRAVMLQVPETMLDERRRLGLDSRDEMWEGELHMVPPAGFVHQRVGSRLLIALTPIAEAHGLIVQYETGVFAPQHKDSYRVPDLVVVDPAQTSERGVEGRAAIVIELLSPDDESLDKLPFYARLGIPEIWLIDPATRVPAIYVLHEQVYLAQPTIERAVHSPVLDLDLIVADGPRLRLRWPGGSVDI